jgi:hypothetical protein
MIDNKKPIKVVGMLLVLAGFISAAILAQSQPTAPAQNQALTADRIQDMATINEQIQAQIDNIASQGGKVNQIKGGSAGTAAVSPTLTMLTLYKAAYCYLNTGANPAAEVIVFTTGDYIYSTNSAFFSSMASACPGANTLYVDISGGSWTTLYVDHN